MLKTLIIATVLLPTLVIAQQSQQLPQPRQPGQWCPAGWMASGSYCVPGSDKAPAAISQERLVSGGLARERQLLHSLRVRSCEHPWHHPALSSALKRSRLRSPRQPMPHRSGGDEQMFGAE